MSHDATVPTRSAGFPLRTVRLVVEEGPDAGAEHAAGDVVTVGTAQGNDLVLTDTTVSRYHLEVRRQADRFRVTDLGSTNGTAIGPVLLEDASVALAAGTTVALGNTRVRVLDGEVAVLRMPDRGRRAGLEGNSAAMLQLLSTLEQVAPSSVSVLVLGESGTGKELVARALHDLGDRARGPFVTVDCGAISPSLFASELFGHERGAFTGAERRHAGAFERADGGTLFLDEIGELEPAQQTALLGVLERRRVQRVGGREEISVDVRLVCATHRDLRSRVNAGEFRLDLYYRLAVVLLHVPALRERIEDVPVLVEHFLRVEGYDGAVDELFDAEATARLRAHRWPGNVRELRNVVSAALALGQPPRLEPAGPWHAPALGELEAGMEALLDRPYREARGTLTQAFERAYLARLLERAGGNVRKASRIAQMNRSYLIELLKRHELPDP